MSGELSCAACGVALDAERYARCDVCDGRTYCVTCGRAHLCTDRCAGRGCIAGLCVRVVARGVISERYGIDA